MKTKAGSLRSTKFPSIYHPEVWKKKEDTVPNIGNETVRHCRFHGH
jgi:hypothetical protein